MPLHAVKCAAHATNLCGWKRPWKVLCGHAPRLLCESRVLPCALNSITSSVLTLPYPTLRQEYAEMLAAGEDGQWKDFLPPMGSGPDIPKLFKSASKARLWSCHSAYAFGTQ